MASLSAAGRKARHAFAPSPVLVKELRSRFRGPRAFVILTVFLVLLAAVAYMVYRMQTAQYSSGYYHAGRASEIGKLLFSTIAFLQVFLMAFIAPSLTMNAISGEVERQTYELLLATPLSGWSILRGKLGAALAYVMLLVFGTLPVMSLAFLFGGVSGTALVVAELTALVVGLEFLTIGLFYTSVFKRTARSAIASYATVAALSILPVFFTFFFSITEMSSSGLDDSAMWALLQVSPFAVVALSIAEWGLGVGGTLVSWGQAMFLHVLIATTFYLLAGARIRRVGPAWGGALAVNVLLYLGWLLWVLIVPLDIG